MQARGAARAPLTPHCHPQCQHIVGICQSIVGCSPPALLDRRAVLQRVGLALSPSPQSSPPMSPGTPTLPLGLWQSPPTSSDTPALPPNQWSSSPGSSDTQTPPSDLLGSPQPLLSARLVSPLHPSASLCLGTPSPLLKPPSWPPQGFEITSTSSCLHFVSATTSEVSEGLPLPVTPLSLSHSLLCPVGNTPHPGILRALICLPLTQSRGGCLWLRPCNSSHE